MDYEIARAFENGDYKRASELLQNVRDFNNRNLLRFYPRNYKHMNCNKYKVTLLHLAAYHGWLDICEQLITEYKYNPHVEYSFESLTDLSTQSYFFSRLPPPPPLFYATLNGNYEVVKYLINKCDCHPHQQSKDGETLLYLACLPGHFEIVTYLISKCHCDPNTGGSYNPLHGACKGGNLKIVNYLTSLSSVDVNIKDKDGYTPLHKTCHYGQLDITKFLVSLSSVDVNIQDDSGYTPLHTACEYGQLDIIKFLLSLPSVDVKIRISNYSVLLHKACRYGELKIIKFLVSLPSVDVNSKDNNGYTPLHTACRYGQLDIIKFLVSLSSVDVNIQNGSGYTPLHTACRYGQLHIMKFLVSLSSVDVNIQNGSSYIPLHTACRYGQLDIMKFLVSLSSVDVNIQDGIGYTPLYTACRYSQLDIIKFLMSIEQVNPISTDINGNTPLHLVCSSGNVDIVKYLLSTGRIDPMAKNRYQETPLQVAGNQYYILKLFEPFKQCRVDFPVESYSKVFLCGNTTNGKSSLISTLNQRVKGISLLERLNPFKQQEKAEPLTAGIVPHHLQSNEIGNIVLYDFAGHPEYYSSHEAVLENLMLRSPAVFIILIKLTDKLEDIEKQLYYWAGFIQNVCSRVLKKSQVIVVGSHADKWRAMNGKDLIKRIDIKKIIENQEYKGFVAMDCRNQTKSSFDKFLTYLSESTQTVVDRSDSISFYCHVLYAFLNTKVYQMAISLDNLAHRVQDENEPALPSNESVLSKFLTILSDKGLIVFIRSTDSINSWVIINKSSLLKEINGKLFAPSYFKEYRSTLASNTGIVPLSALSDVFPQYDPDMLVGFLKSLEFCHEIDENTLKIISTNLSSSSEKLLYFPALVSVEPSSEVTITDGFGWCLWCPNPYQFFSTRFLHVLLLRLAYTFSLKVSGGGIIQSNPIHPFDRSCIIWKNGICWTRDGVKTVVQGSEHNRSVILLVQPNDGTEYCEIRSSVIKKIMEVKNKFCICPDTKEFLISRHQLHTALQCNLADLSLYEVQDVARAVVLKKKSITNDRSETLDISSLLVQFEPYHSLPLSVIHQLFDDSKVSQCIPEHLLREIQEICRPIMDIYPVTRESSTYQSVRDHLNRFSIFAGRNPFDIADPVLTDDERKMICQSFSITTNVEPLSYTIPDDTLGSSQYSVPVSDRNLTTPSCDVATDSTTPLTIFTRHVNEMLGVISDPDTERLPNDLSSANLIPYSIKDDLISTKGLSRYQKASKLLNEIERSFSNLNTPETLEKFCLVLKKQENSALKRMAGEMLKELDSIQDGVGLVSSRNLTTDLKSPLNIFVRHMCEMLDAISDPDTERLPNDLTSANLIPYSIKDDLISTKGLSRYQKASILLNEIHRSLLRTNKPEILENFSEVLTKQENPALTRIAEHMLKELYSC